MINSSSSNTSSATSTDVEDSDNPTSQTPRQNHLITSVLREDGHIYSIAVDHNILYTGSDTKHIQIQNTTQQFPPFKSTSGLVKAIVISNNRNKIFTGHQDGKIRVWKINPQNPTHHKRIATLPTFFHTVKASVSPKNYVQVRRHRTAVWIKHTDAISCLCMDREEGLLYSASWDRTFKVWSVSVRGPGNNLFKCVESVKAHDDAVNAVAVSGGGVVYSGSADGSVKVWRREEQMMSSGGKKVVRHVLEQTLLSQDCAVTSLAVNESDTVVYCGSSDGLVNFWERSKHLSHGGVLRGHKLAVLCLATAGSLVLSGSADKSICVWRREEGVVHTCLTVLRGHTGPVKCLAVAAEGDEKWLVYSGSLDKSVKVWSVSEYMTPDFRHMDFMKVRHDTRGFEFNWESIPLVKY